MAGTMDQARDVRVGRNTDAERLAQFVAQRLLQEGEPMVAMECIGWSSERVMHAAITTIRSDATALGIGIRTVRSVRRETLPARDEQGPHEATITRIEVWSDGEDEGRAGDDAAAGQG